MRRIAAKDGMPVLEAFDPADAGDQEVRIRMAYSAVSPGTELMHLRNKTPRALLGYSGAGVVESVGSGVRHLRPGQRAAVYGVPTHSDVIVAPKHLTVPVPDSVDLREAAFAGIGAIAIHALRQADLRFGESMVVVGLGMLGQLTAQIGHAAAYVVLATDNNESRCRIAARRLPGSAIGSTEAWLESRLQRDTEGGLGADCVMLCAGGGGDSLLEQSVGWLRDRGRIVIVGVPNPAFDRNALFAKEADIRISRAGGPGRYDPSYEAGGVDYPLGYVRWTEGRNLSAFLRLLEERRIDLKPLITSEWPLGNAAEAYRRCAEAPAEEVGLLFRAD
ncbi:zinc-dependent alcohol dehydrogenase [Cohnella hashimotonis]|uniref:Zinc-binding alcohol dehydrogenase n=1 Tax=Cohnella hashimotonis TaxID=2826895 RepID=A0ABT6TA78_9BACL|nr:zinc-binding alcohol dehydrogenase [Cohnella hashimotonis]MDI4643456.1 zinc-binding alcohol dehydrogenase [Cohnella hashimotonis]